MVNNTTNRDKSNGQYCDTRLDKVCTCGHTLGAHTADKRAGVQPCLADDCACECFKLDPKRTAGNVATLAEAEAIAATWRADGFRVGVSGQSDNGQFTGSFRVDGTRKRS